MKTSFEMNQSTMEKNFAYAGKQCPREFLIIERNLGITEDVRLCWTAMTKNERKITTVRAFAVTGERILVASKNSCRAYELLNLIKVKAGGSGLFSLSSEKITLCFRDDKMVFTVDKAIRDDLANEISFAAGVKLIK